MNPIREWHIVISGFLQKAGDINGMVLLWGELRQFLSRDVAVELRSWSCNMADLAEQISRLRPDDGPPRICVYGYSWGGMTSVNLAHELRRRGLEIDRMVLTDAVYRHWYWFGWWRAFAPWRAIRVPANVQRLTHFRQRRSLPCGHRVLAVNPERTQVEPVQWLDVDHSWMDDQPEFRRACIAAAMGE